MKLIIDRFEGAYAVCEMPDQAMVNIPLLVLPNAVEGDVINISIDKDETNQRKNKIENLMKNVWAD